jgi:hypothetical protein
VRTILAARAAGDEPPGLKQLTALSAIGLETVPLTERESAAGDMLGGVLLMSGDLLFSSNPFSPYYADRSHPDLLSRVHQAVRLIEAAPNGAPLKAETDLMREELRRFAAIGDWPHQVRFGSLESPDPDLPRARRALRDALLIWAAMVIVSVLWFVFRLSLVGHAR